MNGSRRAKSRVKKLVEERDHLGLVFGRSLRVEIGRDAGEINALAQIVGAAILEPLEEDRDAFRGRRLPVVIEHAPEIVGNRVLLGERKVDHRQDRPLAGEDAAQEERNDRVLDISAIEVRGDSGAKPGQGRGWAMREVGGLILGRRHGARKAARRKSRRSEKKRPPLDGLRRIGACGSSASSAGLTAVSPVAIQQPPRRQESASLDLWAAEKRAPPFHSPF